MEPQTETEQRPLHPAPPITVGVAALLGVLLGCGLGTCAIGVLPFTLVHSDSVSASAPDFLSYLSRVFVVPVVVSAVPFALLVTLAHGLIITPRLPRPVARRWGLATFTGALGYWIMGGMLFFFPMQHALTSLDRLILPTEDTPDQVIIVALLGGVGAVVGAVSGAVLGGVQWLVLRHYVAGAGRWVAYLIIGNAVLVGTLLAFWLWGTRWGWN